MITAVDVIRAYSEKVAELFGAPPVTKDIIEVTDRPCTIITPGEITTEIVGGLKHDVLPLQIVYFAPFSYRGYLTLLQVQQTLSKEIPGPVEVAAEFHVMPEDVDIALIRDDMLLTCDFTVEYFQEMNASWMEEGSADAMEGLHVSLDEGTFVESYLTDEEDDPLTAENDEPLTDEDDGTAETTTITFIEE